jgi:hypothetical protein
MIFQYSSAVSMNNISPTSSNLSQQTHFLSNHPSNPLRIFFLHDFNSSFKICCGQISTCHVSTIWTLVIFLVCLISDKERFILPFARIAIQKIPPMIYVSLKDHFPSTLSFVHRTTSSSSYSRSKTKTGPSPSY